MTAEPPPDAAPGAERDPDPDAESDAPGSELRAMRAVWLEMRDEEPPARGLSDLLAAAHSRAEAMRPRPSWWQRLLAGMRRPAALAFATIVVLIAGAVLLGRRTVDEGGMAAPPASQPAEDPVGGRPADQREMREARDEIRPRGPLPSSPPPATLEASPAAPAPQLRSAPDVPADDVGPGAGRAPDPTRAAPAPRAGRPEAKPATPGPRSDRTNDERPVSPEPRTEGASKARSSDPVGPPVVRPRPPAPAAKAPPRPHPAGGAALFDDGFGEGLDPRRGSGSAADLIRQCEAAAQRGDCDAVRRLVAQIARTDRDYPARVGPDSAIGKCLLAN